MPALLDRRGIPLWILTASLAIPGARAATPVESLSLTHEQSVSTSFYNSGFSTPLTSKDGYFYWVYVTTGTTPGFNHVVISQKKPDGTITTHTVFDALGADDYHNASSVGIDRNGRVHVFCGARYGWEYYISNAPHNITAFTRQAPYFNNGVANAATRTNYPTLFNGLEGRLYLTCRLLVSSNNSASQYGAQGGVLARYEESPTDIRGSYTLLGSNNYRPVDYTAGVTLPKLLAWSDKGPTAHKHYQSHQISIHIDPTGRFHYAAVMYDNSTDIDLGASHVIYAYSDDRGETWRAADGSSLALPLNFNDPKAVVYFDSTRTLIRSATITTDHLNRPVIGYYRIPDDGDPATNDYKLTTTVWNGSAWQAITGMTNPYSPEVIGTGDRYGGFLTSLDLYANSLKVYRSNDAGLTVRTSSPAYPNGHALGYSNSTTVFYDQNALRQGVIRFVSLRSNGDNGAANSFLSRVYTLNTPAYSSAYAAPPPPAQIRAAASGDTALRITWEDRASTETAQQLQRALAADFSDAVTFDLAADLREYLDSAAPDVPRVYYRVRAQNAFGWSAWSPVLTYDRPDLQAEVVSNTRIRLRWANRSAYDRPIIVERAVGAGAFTEIVRLPATAREYHDDTPLDALRYRVRTGGATAETSNTVTLAYRYAYATIQAESHNAAQGINTTGSVIGSVDAGDWVRYDNVNFRDGPASVTVRLASGFTGTGYIDFRTESASGTVFATLPVTSTGGYGAYPSTPSSVNVASAPTGLRTVFLTFRGGSGVANIDWLRFNPATSYTAPASAPASLTATVANATALLDWPAVAGAARYHLERLLPVGDYVQVAETTAAAAEFVDPTYPGSGLPSYRVRASNPDGFTAYRAATATAATALAAWRHENFHTLLPTGNAADSADPDRDNLGNLLEYALDLDPANAADGPIGQPRVGTTADNKLTLTFFRARADITYTVQASEDLVTWADLIPVNPGTVGHDVTFTDSVALSATPSRFLRLKVTAP